MAEFAKPEASIQFIGLLIAKDPAMTAKILQMINSSVFALARQITDPVEAVLHLGVESTKAMILLASVNLHFDKSGCPGFSHEQLWRHSMAVGAFSRAVTMAQTKDIRLAEAAFTAGLLHDIGKLLLAANVSEDYSRVIEQAQRRKISVREVEIEIFDASHAELAACVLGTWGLPASILEAIAWHHCPEASDDSAFSILTAVHVANAVEHEKLSHQAGCLVSQIDSHYVHRLGLAERRNAWRTACGFDVRVVDDTKKERFRLKQEAKEWEG
jgi:putative nucleotidyltransferase with HDIG domain